MNEHHILVVTLWLVSFGFLLKAVIFGVASGIMIYQKGTSRLAHAVKWFFLIMTIQDIIFATLYAAGAYESMDTATQVLNVAVNNLIRVTGVVAIYSAAGAGAFFIWVLSKRVRVLIDYEELDRTQDRKWLKD